MEHSKIAGVCIGRELSNLLCIMHYSAHVPELYCLMKVFGPKRCRRKRIAEPNEDCSTNHSCEKVLQYNVKYTVFSWRVWLLGNWTNENY